MTLPPVDRIGLEAILEPGSSGRMLPREAYTSECVLEWEREHLFARSWVCAGRSALVAEAGTRYAVNVAGEAILLVRGDDGALRGFFNVCRHRGHEIMPCGASAKRSAIHCPYHAWTYTLDGELFHTPRFEAPAGFEMSEHGLIPVRVEEWQGWVFVNASGNAMSLTEHLGAFTQMVRPWEPERLVVGATHEYRSTANWKLPIENYQECYHCSAIHPELCVVSPPESGDNYHESGMWAGGTMVFADHAETMSLDGKSGGVMLPGLNSEQLREVIYIGLFPNMLISLHPDYVMTHRIEPISADDTWVECQWLFDPEAVARPDFDPSYAVDFWDITNRQDWAACEGVQRGLQSRGYRPGPFSMSEDAVCDWVQWLARSYLAGEQAPATV
jgi:Rieske 2Fe-2S family protein